VDGLVFFNVFEGSQHEAVPLWVEVIAYFRSVLVVCHVSKGYQHLHLLVGGGIGNSKRATGDATHHLIELLLRELFVLRDLFAQSRVVSGQSSGMVKVPILDE